MLQASVSGLPNCGSDWAQVPDQAVKTACQPRLHSAAFRRVNIERIVIEEQNLVGSNREVLYFILERGRLWLEMPRLVGKKHLVKQRCEPSSNVISIPVCLAGVR